MDRLINGECVYEMQKLIDEGVKVDAIICDPPYGTTGCKWDSIIDLDEMWKMLKQLVKDDNTPIVLFGAQPFTSVLVNSNLKGYKYNWIWEKYNVSNPMVAKTQPLSNYEEISVFTKTGKKANYYPQGLLPYGKETKQGIKVTDSFGGGKRNTSYIQEFTNYPRRIQKFKYDKNKVHPTQKPVELMEYLVKTYTNEGDTVLDFTMGSGSTGVACVNLNRRFIGIELDKGYFDVAKTRIGNE